MFTGFNSNVEFDGQVYHVQTEDKGLANPILETRVFKGGQVMVSVQHSYADLADSPDYSHGKIQRRMKDQHHGLVEDLENGRLESGSFVRPSPEVIDPDPHHLLEEYLENWIDNSQLMAPVHHALESQVDHIRRGQKKNS